MSKKSETLITSGPPLSPSQASCPPSSEPAQTKLELIQCFFPDLLQDIRKDSEQTRSTKNTIFWTYRNIRMQLTLERIGRAASLREKEALPPDFVAPQPVMKPTWKEVVIFWNYQFLCTFSLPGLPVGCYAVEDILEECWAGTPEALQPSSAKRCRSRASCCRSQGGRWPCPPLSRCGRQARSRYIDGGHQVVTSGCLYLGPWQTGNKSSLKVK